MTTAAARGRIVIDLFTTLDGVAQAPNGREEDPSGGFRFGGWQSPFDDAVIGQDVGDGIRRMDALLLGRRTYELFAAYWPRHVDLLTHHGKANSLERWQHKSKCAAVLRELAEGTLPLAADAIMTRAQSGQSVAFLLSLLVRSGVLPELDVEAARFDHWLENWLSEVGHAEDRLVLRRYCTWELLRSTRAFRAVSRGPSSPAAGFQRQRAALKYCAALLHEIRSHRETLATFPQRRLDAFLTDSRVSGTRWHHSPAGCDATS